jgi:hypothetical protein
MMIRIMTRSIIEGGPSLGIMKGVRDLRSLQGEKQ